MAYSKIELFNSDLQRCAGLYKALAHPARLAILKYLADSRTCIAGDFAFELPLSRTTVSQHLKELRNAGLIISAVKGAKTYYCLNAEKIKELEELSQKFLNGINIPINYKCE